VPAIAFDITLRRPLADGKPFGDAGPYEELKGRLRFALDPNHAANRGITDIALAPTTPRGLVEFAADLSLLLPVDRARCSGRVLVDVVNRGNTVSVPNFNHATRPVFGADSDPNPPVDVGDGFLMRRGWVVASCGWQGDLPELPGLFRLHGVEARDNDAPLRGRVYVQCQAPENVPHFLLSDRGHQPYRAADLDERDAVLTVRDMPDAAPEVIARARWKFARVDGGRVVPDAGHVWLEGGFAKGRLYHVAYTAIGAPVMGLGIAALRDCAAWLKHADAAAGNPAPGALRWAHAYGRSQTGRLLRTLLHYGLNVDESGREAFDGVLANVAGGMRGEFNQRFGQNSKDRPWTMAHLEPFQVEPRGRVKVVYTNTSAEYHRGDASLVHTDPDGGRDMEHGANVRVYHFAGTEHGLGVWPPSNTQVAAADPHGWVERAQHLRGVMNYGRLLRACLVSLDRWVSEGVAPPASRHPRVADGTAVAPETLAGVFGAIPGAHYPRRHARPQRVDFGADPELRRVSVTPPRVGPPYGTRVAAVNADGNEVGGVILPELAVPLATHTGWNPRHPDIGGGDQLLVFAGATLPFPKTRAEREATRDPRPSIAERYASRSDYLARVRDAAEALVKDGYLLEEDVETSIAFGRRLWDWAT
jgi:alpha/beta hydrolase family protein